MDKNTYKACRRLVQYLQLELQKEGSYFESGVEKGLSKDTEALENHLDEIRKDFDN